MLLVVLVFLMLALRARSAVKSRTKAHKTPDELKYSLQIHGGRMATAVVRGARDEGLCDDSSHEELEVPIDRGVWEPRYRESRLRDARPVTEPRVPPLGDDELSASAQALLAPMIEAGRDYNIFRTMAQHPDLARRWMVFANHVLTKSTLPPRERELAILRIGWLCESEYEFAQHRLLGEAAGLTTEEIERLKLGPEAGWSALDELILKATDELHHERCVADSTWAGLSEHWSTQQMMDLVFAVGQYTLVSMALRSFGVVLDDFLPDA